MAHIPIARTEDKEPPVIQPYAMSKAIVGIADIIPYPVILFSIL